MTTPSTTLIIAANRFRLMTRNKVLILLCLLLPLMFSLMVNRIFAKSSLYDSIPMAIIDKDNSETSQNIVSNIRKNKTIHLEVIRERDIENYISKEKVQAVYILKEGMEKSIQAGNYNNLVSVYAVPGSITAMGISDIIAGEIVPYICESKLENGASSMLKGVSREDIKKGIMKEISKLMEDQDYELPVRIEMKTPERSSEEDTQKGDIFSAEIGLGMILMFSTIFMLAGCSTIIKERENRIRSRIKVSGVSPFSLLVADIAAVSAAGAIITLLQFVMLYGVLKGSTAGTIASVSAACIVYILCAAALLIFLAAVFKSHITFQSFMPVVILVMGILSGCIWSVEMMPAAMEKVSAFIPTYWAHKALTEVIMYGGGFGSIVKGLEILGLMTAVFVLPSYIIYRRE
ncbi:MAG: ABC transporter permease [Bacillota bacterium]|nr:ABC transporter permease [Bacillota bacterium]